MDSGVLGPSTSGDWGEGVERGEETVDLSSQGSGR